MPGRRDHPAACRVTDVERGRDGGVGEGVGAGGAGEGAVIVVVADEAQGGHVGGTGAGQGDLEGRVALALRVPIEYASLNAAVCPIIPLRRVIR